MWYPLYIDGDLFALEYIRRAQGGKNDTQNPLSAVPLGTLEEQMVTTVLSEQTEE